MRVLCIGQRYVIPTTNAQRTSTANPRLLCAALYACNSKIPLVPDGKHQFSAYTMAVGARIEVEDEE